MDIRKEIKKYLNHCEFQKKLSQKSLKAYSIDLRQFISHFYKDEEQSFTKVGIPMFNRIIKDIDWIFGETNCK